MAPIYKPWRAMALAGALVLAGCEPGALDSAPPNADLPEELSSVVTSAPDTATAASGSHSLLVAEGLHHLVAMAPPAQEDGTLGAGCADANADELADGDWYVFVLEQGTATVTVDVACVYGRDTEQFQAYAAMDSEAADNSALVNHVVINDVIHEVTLRVAADAQAYLAVTQWEPISAEGFAVAAKQTDGDDHRGVWLRVKDGVVTSVVQPYAMGTPAG